MRLPRRLNYKIIAAGLLLAPVVSTAGSVNAASGSVSVFQGLTLGSSGESVKSLQEALISKGFVVRGGVDGRFGPKTLFALNEFQLSIGLEVTKSVDESTAIALGTVASPLTGLSLGSKGVWVISLQEALIAAGFPPKGGADGSFGPMTKRALIAFQRAVGLDATGTVDEVTAARLLSGSEIGSPTEVEKPTPSKTKKALSPKLSKLVGVKFGSSGAAARAVQKLILDAGISLRGGADGSFGRLSEAALKSFQTAQGFKSTGIANKRTIRRLAKVSSQVNEPAVVVPAEFSQLVGLRPGALGESVAALQRRLLDLGVTVRGGADGIFGPATANALKTFQKERKLEVTGIVNDSTAIALWKNDSNDSSEEDSSGTTSGFGVYGETSNRVAALQKALIKAGITVRGGADGVFGSATSAAVMSFQRRESLHVTGVVNLATAEKLGLEAAAAPSNSPVATVALDAFPVQGMCGFSDSWHADRSGGRLHLGVDIIAKEGKLLYAVADGTITKTYIDRPGSLAGNGIRLTKEDGTYFFYAHLSAFADGIEVGTEVAAGQVIGYVGNTGNSGTPHLHFEVHPDGGAAVNPYPIVKAIDGCAVTDPVAVMANN